MGSKIFVGNLAFKTTRDQVETLFAEVGALKDVFLPTDRETGRPRGFAFVEFESEEQAQQAIDRFNGHELDGRPLRVNIAEDRPRRSGPPFAGGGYGGGDFGGGGGDFGGGGGGGYGGGKPKGSRRNIRAKKRSL
jgi:cold-inducible RNA-binding protein